MHSCFRKVRTEVHRRQKLAVRIRCFFHLHGYFKATVCTESLLTLAWLKLFRAGHCGGTFFVRYNSVPRKKKPVPHFHCELLFSKREVRENTRFHAIIYEMSPLKILCSCSVRMEHRVRPLERSKKPQDGVSLSLDGKLKKKISLLAPMHAMDYFSRGREDLLEARF